MLRFLCIVFKYLEQGEGTHDLFFLSTKFQPTDLDIFIIKKIQVKNYMGEKSIEYWDGTADGNLFYHDVYNCHWNYFEHSNWMCLKEE